MRPLCSILVTISYDVLEKNRDSGLDVSRNAMTRVGSARLSVGALRHVVNTGVTTTKMVSVDTDSLGVGFTAVLQPRNSCSRNRKSMEKTRQLNMKARTATLSVMASQDHALNFVVDEAPAAIKVKVEVHIVDREVQAALTSTAAPTSLTTPTG